MVEPVAFGEILKVGKEGRKSDRDLLKWYQVQLGGTSGQVSKWCERLWQDGGEDQKVKGSYYHFHGSLAVLQCSLNSPCNFHQEQKDATKDRENSQLLLVVVYYFSIYYTES